MRIVQQLGYDTDHDPAHALPGRLHMRHFSSRSLDLSSAYGCRQEKRVHGSLMVR